jgi:hypothetical protein
LSGLRPRQQRRDKRIGFLGLHDRESRKPYDEEQKLVAGHIETFEELDNREFMKHIGLGT